MKNLGKIIILSLILAILSFIFLLFKTQVLAIDNTLFYAINGLSNPILDVILIPITYFGSVIIWILAIIIFWIKKDKKLSIHLLYALIVSSFLSLLLKSIFMRPRPLGNLREYLPIEVGEDYSFPSGHAMNAFAGATILSDFYKKYKILFYALAILTGISRIYIGAHYPLDVLYGSIIGILIGSIVMNLPIYSVQEEIEKAIYSVKSFLRL